MAVPSWVHTSFYEEKVYSKVKTSLASWRIKTLKSFQQYLGGCGCMLYEKYTLIFGSSYLFGTNNWAVVTHADASHWKVIFYRISKAMGQSCNARLYFGHWTVFHRAQYVVVILRYFFESPPHTNQIHNFKVTIPYSTTPHFKKQVIIQSRTRYINEVNHFFKVKKKPVNIYVPKGPESMWFLSRKVSGSCIKYGKKIVSQEPLNPISKYTFLKSSENAGGNKFSCVRVRPKKVLTPSSCSRKKSQNPVKPLEKKC